MKKCAFFFAVIEQIYTKCTFINTASRDEQHALYRIVLTQVSDATWRLSGKVECLQIYLLVAINSNHGVTFTDMTAATGAVLFPSEKVTSQ